MSARGNDVDADLLVAFLDGELDDASRTRLELRLASDPELARALDELAAMDGLAERHAARRAARVVEARHRFGAWKRLVAVAAAVVALLIVARLLVRNAPAALDVEVALAPSYESAREAIAHAPELDGLVPPGLETVRGSVEPPNVDAATFVERARAIDAPRAASATPTAGFYVVPLRVPPGSSASAIVVQLPRRGAGERVFPPRDDPAPAARARMESGSHVIPGPRFELDADGARVVYRRGLLVPIGSGGLDVLVAVRRSDIDGDVLARVDRRLAAKADRESVSALLRTEGFEVRELAIDEPKD